MTKYRQPQPAFRQHSLSESHLQAGIFSTVDDVRIPAEPIAMTGFTAGELEQRTGISFRESFDDLDLGKFAVLTFTGGFNVLLIERENSPAKGVIILTDQEGTRSEDRLEIILSGLRISRSELTWILPELEQKDQPVYSSWKSPCARRAKGVAQPRIPPGS